MLCEIGYLMFWKWLRPSVIYRIIWLNAQQLKPHSPHEGVERKCGLESRVIVFWMPDDNANRI